MTPSFTAEERDAIYGLVLERLSGIDDVWRAVRAEDFAAAQLLGLSYSDDLRLIAEDLGWGPGGEVTAISTPSDVLVRALSRLSDDAASHRASRGEERTEIFRSDQRDHLVVNACRRVLLDLEAIDVDDREPASEVESRS